MTYAKWKVLYLGFVIGFCSLHWFPEDRWTIAAVAISLYIGGLVYFKQDGGIERGTIEQRRRERA